jgi:hypothetical protein
LYPTSVLLRVSEKLAYSLPSRLSGGRAGEWPDFAVSLKARAISDSGTGCGYSCKSD